MTTRLEQLTQDGVLRIGFNVANALLVQRDGPGLKGIAPALGARIGQALGAPVRELIFDTPTALEAGLRAGACDIAFLAADPSREDAIAFTAPYLEIDAGYLVRQDHPATHASQVDAPGMRIAVPEASAYGMWLRRHLRHAEFVATASPADALRAFSEQGLDAVAGLKSRLHEDVGRQPGWRVLDGRFTAVQQAVGCLRPHAQAHAFLSSFIQMLLGAGEIARLVKDLDVRGVSVPAPT